MKTSLLGIKSAILFAGIIILSSPSYSKPRSQEEALSLARNYIVHTENPKLKTLHTSLNLSLAYVCRETPLTRSTESLVYYYVFNFGEENGFVLVSGDDRIKPILGIADKGSYIDSLLPPNYKNWMFGYQKQIQFILNRSESLTKDSASVPSKFTNALSATKQYAASVSPLLDRIKWDQEYPYNRLCPIIQNQQTPTGCVATAMAQVMKYYKWPVQGTGSHAYKHAALSDSLKADFGNTIYQWDSMKNTYDREAFPNASSDEVARLMYHCGVSVDMNYSPSGSGAFTTTVPLSMHRYFGYDANAQIYNRDYYTEAEWLEKIRTDLNAARPIIYGGNDVQGNAHQFICDGYNSDHLYHFNWGWNGYADGYFELSSLNVESPGIGGGSGGFSIGQDMITGIKKPTAGSAKDYQLYLNRTSQVSANLIPRNGLFDFTFGFYNNDSHTFLGQIALALYKNNAYYSPIILYTNVEVKSYYGISELTLDSLGIPLNVLNGSYQLYVAYRNNGQTNWSYMRNRVGTPSFFNVTITGTSISFTEPDVYPSLSLTDTIRSIGALYANQTARLSATVKNEGGEYNSYLIFALESLSNGSIHYLTNDPINIPSGMTKTIELTSSLNFPVGHYLLHALVDKKNNQFDAEMDLLGPSTRNSVPVQILETPTAIPVLTLTDSLRLMEYMIPNNSEIVLTAKVKNTGGYYNNLICAFIFTDSLPTSVDYVGPKTTILDSAEEKTLTFRKTLDLPNGAYRAVLYAYDSGLNAFRKLNSTAHNGVHFEMITPTAVNAMETKLRIFPNPASDVLHIETHEVIEQLTITDVTGRKLYQSNPKSSGPLSVQLSGFASGIYLLQVETSTGSATQKFLKQ